MPRAGRKVYTFVDINNIMHYNLRLDDEWVPLRSERTSRRAGVVW